MKTRRMMLCLHSASLVTAYALLALAYFIVPRSTNMGALNAAVSTEIFMYAGLSFLTGVGSMFVRSGKAESITLALSTIAAFVLLLLA